MRTQRMRATVVWAIVVVYAVAVGVHVMPASAIRRTLIRSANLVVRPYFTQRWNLFAPVPPSANLSSLMLVRYRDGGVVKTTGLIDLSAAVRRASTSQRWAPPRLTRVVTKYNVAFEARAYADVRVARRRKIDPLSPLPPSYAREVVRRRAPQLSAYARVLSAAARAQVPARAEIVAVRGLVVRTAVVDFAHRRRRGNAPKVALADADAPARLLPPDVVADKQDVAVVFDSDWLPYARDVTRLKVAL